ncbi:MAG: serine--tRNA ligase, partial [Acidobacteria bacterium]|nr:serine--tRNA ligase [Acidobacteriota bacterium]
MLDLNFVRENLEKVRAALEARRFPTEALDDFERADAERRRVIAESDSLNAERNSAGREIGALMKEGKKEEAESRRSAVGQLKERITELDRARDEAEARMREILSTIPNVPDESVPVGEEANNREERRWGTPPTFDFEPQDHVDLGTALGILDLERAAKIASARFAILNGAGARLERALINFMLDVHTREHGYKETLPPFIVNQDALFGTTQLPKFEGDLFKLRDDRDLYLIPTAEVPVTNYHREEILDAAQLPMHMVAYTP